MVYAIIIIYLFIVAIIIYDVIKYRKNKVLEEMRNGEIETVKIKWKIISTRWYAISRAQNFRWFFKARWENKEKRVFRSQDYPYYLSFPVKEWDSVDIYLNEKNPKYYYVDDDFIVNKFGLADDVYKMGFMRVVTIFLLLVLLIVDIVMFIVWIWMFQGGDLMQGGIFVWIWILVFIWMISLFQGMLRKKKHLKKTK